MLAPVYALKYHGRATMGSFVAQETFEDDSAGSERNDFNIMSGRLYLHLSEMGSRDYAFIGDLRDKLDFFNKLDREKLELNARNKLQVRQLYLQYPNQQGQFFYNIGRFGVFETGSIYLDGVQIGIRPFDHFSFSLFAGANPKKEVDSHLEFDAQAQNKGLSLVYFNKRREIGGYYYVASSFVLKTYQNEVDRKYIFHNSIIQFNHFHRLSSLLYFDFVPTTKIQNLWINYWGKVKKRYSFSLSLSRIDVIEYSRKRDIRETLEPSVYDQGQLKIKLRSSATVATQYKISYGIRQQDGLTKVDGQVGWLFNRFLKRKMNASLLLGKRKNFASDDLYAKMGIGHFSKKWEFSLDQEIISESKLDFNDFAFISEINISYNFSRRIFTSFSLQYARDNFVKILSTFFKLSYRFGNKEVAPIRDGAPRQGRL